MTWTIRFALVLLTLFASCACAYAEHNADAGGKPRALTLEAASYFRPMSGPVTAVTNGIVYGGLTGADGLRTGMRLDVMARGDVYRHPITGTPIGSIETYVGRVEAVEVGEVESSFRILEGNPEAGQTLRRSAAPVRVLFYQHENVDWDLSEEYYYQLQEQVAFEIADAAPGKRTIAEILPEARAMGAEAVIVLRPGGEAGAAGGLTQSIYWTSDGALLNETGVSLNQDEIGQYKLAGGVFSQGRNEAYAAFSIPFTTGTLAVGDLDLDGMAEIAVPHSGEVRFYNAEYDLSPALQGAIIGRKGQERPVRIQIEDLDADGRPEVIVTSMAPYSAITRVYAYAYGEFVETAHAERLARVSPDGSVYVQDFSASSGPGDGVYEIKGGDIGAPVAATSRLGLPGGADLYNFALMPLDRRRAGYLMFGYDGRLALYDPSVGGVLWKSPTPYVKAWMPEADDPSAPFTGGDRKLELRGRLLNADGSALALRRTPYIGGASGTSAGLSLYKSTDLVQVSFVGGAVSVVPVIEGAPGGAIDFAVYGGRAYLLVESWGVNPANLMRGEGMFRTRLYVYGLKGL